LANDLVSRREDEIGRKPCRTFARPECRRKLSVPESSTNERYYPFPGLEGIKRGLKGFLERTRGIPRLIKEKFRHKVVVGKELTWEAKNSLICLVANWEETRFGRYKLL